MYKSKKKPKKESPALKFMREMREEQWGEILREENAPIRALRKQESEKQWEQIQRNMKRGKS